MPDRRLDHRQAAGRQQRARGALEDAGEDELAGVLGEPAERRRHGEPDDADDEDLPPAVAVAEAAAEEDQGREGEEVAVADPLQVGEAGVEVLADPDQGDVDDRAVEHGHAGAEDRGRDDAAPGLRGELDRRHSGSLTPGSDAPAER